LWFFGNALMIFRIPGPFSASRSHAVVYNGVVSFFAVSPSYATPMYEQTKAALAEVDRILAQVGSSKDRVLTAMVYIADMERKEEMNRAWDEWADLAHPPMRACVGATLAGDYLVEMVMTAAV
jgi:enamine deaminase RidA (YjgF/YER057c/UK114 family)